MGAVGALTDMTPPPPVGGGVETTTQSLLDAAEVRPLPGYGNEQLGVVATSDLEPGHVVLGAESPFAVSLGFEHLHARCLRCCALRRRRRTAAEEVIVRTTTTHQEDVGGPSSCDDDDDDNIHWSCPEGCGAGWCSEECQTADAGPLHRASGECYFLRRRRIQQQAAKKKKKKNNKSAMVTIAENNDSFEEEGEEEEEEEEDDDVEDIEDDVRLVLRYRAYVATLPEGVQPGSGGLALSSVASIGPGAIGYESGGDESAAKRSSSAWWCAKKKSATTELRLEIAAAAAAAAAAAGVDGGATTIPQQKIAPNIKFAFVGGQNNLMKCAPCEGGREPPCEDDHDEPVPPAPGSDPWWDATLQVFANSYDVWAWWGGASSTPY